MEDLLKTFANKRTAIGLAAFAIVFGGAHAAVAQRRARPKVAKTPLAATLITPQKKYLITTLTKADMAILLKDANPSLLKRLADDPELKKEQALQLREMLAMAGQSVKDGLLDAAVINDLENIRIETAAQLYDKHLNTGKDAKPFGTVTASRIDAFYAKPGTVAAFEKYLDAKLVEAKKEGIVPPDRVLTAEETKEVKDSFARVRIYEAESKLKSRQLGLAYNKRSSLKTRLQQNQFLAELYSRRILNAKVAVTEAEVEGFLAQHKELYEPQKKKAEDILKRLKAGEDFAKLADEFTEDPGNNSPDGKKNGGAYKDVGIGVMVAPFEKAALAVKPGEIFPELVETQFGYHIVKLDRKAETYDVRHILISTSLSNPDNALGRPIPLKEAIRNKLEDEKRDKAMSEILKNNPVTVAEDYVIPTPPVKDANAKLGTD